MRFLEKHCIPILDGKGSPIARAVVPIDISEPARWYFEEAEIYETSLRDQFHTVVAPNPVTFIEYRIPPQWKVKDGEGWKLAKAPHGPSDFFGMLIVQETLSEHFTGRDPSEGAVINDIMRNVPGATWPAWKQFTFCFAGNQQDYQLCFWAEHYAQRDGRMLGGPVHDVNQALINRARKMTDADVYGDMMRTYGFPIYFALSLLPSPDVAVYDDKLKPKAREKAVKSHGMALDFKVVRSRSIREKLKTVQAALDAAAGVWTHTDKQAYVHELGLKFREELKNYRFRI